MSGLQKHTGGKGEVAAAGSAVQQVADSRASRTYQTGILMGLSLGAALLLTGAALCIAGISGSIEWVVTGKGFGSKLANASPGIFFALLGFLIVIWYKPKYRFSVSQTQQETPGKGKAKKPVVTKIQGSGEMSALPDPNDRSAR